MLLLKIKYSRHSISYTLGMTHLVFLRVCVCVCVCVHGVMK